MKTRLNGYENVTHIDSDTGEIICETHGCTTIFDNENKEKEDVVIKDFCGNVNFTKLNHDTINILAEKLTPSEFIFFIRLSQYVSFTDCIIRRTSHGNSKIMDMKSMAEEMDLDYSNVRKMVSSLKKKGLLGTHETGAINIDTKAKKVYTVNPYVMFKGTDVNKTIAEFYKDTGWAELLNYKK